MFYQTNYQTSYTGSPVIEVRSKVLGDGTYRSAWLCLTEEGDIYRVLKFQEKPIIGSLKEINTSELTDKLIEGYNDWFGTGTPCELQKLIYMQRWLQGGCMGIYQMKHDPLYKLNTAGYYYLSYANDQCRLKMDFYKTMNKQREINDMLCEIIASDMKFKNKTAAGRISEYQRRKK